MLPPGRSSDENINQGRSIKIYPTRNNKIDYVGKDEVIKYSPSEIKARIKAKKQRK